MLRDLNVGQVFHFKRTRKMSRGRKNRENRNVSNIDNIHRVEWECLYSPFKIHRNLDIICVKLYMRYFTSTSDFNIGKKVDY